MQTESQYELLTKASGTGQLLTVVYQGGKAPGYKRKIVIRSIDDDSMQVSEFPTDLPKTYFVSKTIVVGDDYPAPWMPEDAGKVTPIEPESYFSGWAYLIPPHFFSALGVNLRYVIDQEKTEPARKSAMARGMSKKEATAHIKIMRSEYTISAPPTYDFHEGDLFYRRVSGSSEWLQIVKIKRQDDQWCIETHFPRMERRDAFALNEEELAHILRTGDAPPDSKQIPPSKSDSEALRLMINQLN